MIEGTKGKEEERRAKGELSSRVSDSRMRLSISERTATRARKNALCIVLLQVLFALLSSGTRYSSQASANEQSRAKALRAAGGFTLAFFAAIRVA